MNGVRDNGLAMLHEFLACRRAVVVVERPPPRSDFLSANPAVGYPTGLAYRSESNSGVRNELGEVFYYLIPRRGTSGGMFYKLAPRRDIAHLTDPYPNRKTFFGASRRIA